ncbi:MAG: AI-2E family transporter [Phycisphaeraceae bacterium]|nr:MAG: AI-2E family transporter [Phycisphaeraceae bacterium]
MAEHHDKQGSGEKFYKLHLWQIQPVRDVLLLLGLFGILYVGYLLSPLTVPMLLALLLAYMFEPLVQRLTVISWVSRSVAAVGIIVAGLVLVVVPLAIGVGYGVVSAASTVENAARQAVAVQRVVVAEDPTASMEELRGVWRRAAEHIMEVLEERREREVAEEEAAADEAMREGTMASYEDFRDELWRDEEVPAGQRLSVTAVLFTVDWVQENWQTVQRRLIEGGVTVAAVTLRLLRAVGLFAFSVFLTTFFFFFFCVGLGRVSSFTEQFIPREHHYRTLDLLKKMDAVVSGFVRGRLTICVIQCVLFSVGYLIVGVPAAVIVGILVGVLAIVPYLSLIGIPVAIVLMALDPGEGIRGAWWWIVLAPTAVYAITQALDDYVLSPLIQGKATGLDTPTVLFCALAGGLLAGFYGLLIGIPVGACIKILLTELVWPRVREWAQGLRADPLPISED